MREEGAIPDVRLADLASRQHGVVTTSQLRAAGIHRSGVARRVRAGRLHRLHRGVYAVGHGAPSIEGRWLAAVLASGEGAALSHRSAGELWGLMPRARGPIHVTVPSGGGRKRRQGLIVHRSVTLTAPMVGARSGVPVTTPERTLRDLGRSLPAEARQRALRRAVDLGLIRPPEEAGDPALTRSELERRFLALCRRHRLPLPEVNARVGPYEVDFLWRVASVIVETDGFRYHGSRSAFERDRARDARLQARGYRVLRFTHRQLREDPDAAVAALRALLG